MFNTSDSLPRSEGSPKAGILKKLLGRRVSRLRRLNSQLEVIELAAGDTHTDFVPWSQYNRTSAGRKIKEAVTGLRKPQRLAESGKVFKRNLQTDPDTGLPLDEPDKPGFKRVVSDKGYSDYPLYTKGKSRYDVGKYLRAKMQADTGPISARIEGLKHGAGETLGKSEEEVREQIQGLVQQKILRKKQTLEEYKKQVTAEAAIEAGGEHRIGPREVRQRVKAKLQNEMSSHRRYMSGEVGAVINPSAPEGKRFRSTGARAIIKARGVNPGLAKAYPEKLTEYNKRLESTVGHHQERAGSILGHGEKHLDSWIARGMGRSGDFPGAAPEELTRQASELRAHISHPEPTQRHYFIPQEKKEALSRYMTLGHPLGKEVSVHDIDRMKDRADSLLQRSSNTAAARRGVLKSGKIFTEPLVPQIKGYPYLKKAGIAGAAIGGAALAGGLIARKIHRNKESRMSALGKILNFEIDPEVQERIMKSVSMDLFREGKTVTPRLTWPSQKKLGAIAAIKHMINAGAIHPEAIAHIAQPTEWIKNKQLEFPGYDTPELRAAQHNQPVPTLHDKWKEEEARRRVVEHKNSLLNDRRKLDEATLNAVRENVESIKKEGYQGGHRVGEKVGYKSGTEAAERTSSRVISGLKESHLKTIGGLKRGIGWGIVGGAGAGLLAGRLIGEHSKNGSKKHNLISKAKEIKFDWLTKKNDSPPELEGENPQWLKNLAHKTLYGRDYSTRAQAASIKKWGGRTKRLVHDIKTRGSPSLDAKGNPKKREWERPWVAGALTTGALVGGVYGLKKGVGFIRSRPLESHIGQLREGFLRANYAEKVPGLQKVGQFVQGVKADVRRMVDKPVKNPKYKFSIVNPATGKLMTSNQIGKHVEQADQLSSLKNIAEGKKKNPDEVFSSRKRLIQLETKPLTRKQKEKLAAEGAGSATVLGALALILRKRRGGMPPGGVHVHNYLHGTGPNFAQQAVESIPKKGVFFKARQKVLNFAAQKQPNRTAVIQDRYRKQIKNADLAHAVGSYGAAAGTGAALGSLLRKAMPLGRALKVGAAGGLATEAATRLYTARSRDKFKERSWQGKVEDRAPAAVGGLVGAGILTKRHFPRAWKTITQFDVPEKKPGDPTTWHDAAVGGIEGAGSFYTTERLLKKLGGDKLGGLSRLAISGVVGGLGTAAAGYGLNRLVRRKLAARKAQESQPDQEDRDPLSNRLSSKYKTIQFDKDHAAAVGAGVGIPGFFAGGLYRGRKLKPGEDITGRRVTRPHGGNPLLQHEGIGTPGGNIVHVQRGTGKESQVSLVNQKEFAKDKAIRILDRKTDTAAASKALAAVGQKRPYSLFLKNCQLFGDECRGTAKLARRVVPRQLRSAIKAGTIAAAAGYGGTKIIKHRHEFAAKENKHPILRGAIEAGGLGVAGVGAGFLPGVANLYRIGLRNVRKSVQGKLSKTPFIRRVIKPGKKDPLEAGKMVRDYIEGSQKILNKGVHGRLIGQALQGAIQKPKGLARRLTTNKWINMDDFGRKHFADFRKGRFGALRAWDKEYRNLIESRHVDHPMWSKDLKKYIIIPGSSDAKHAQKLKVYHAGRQATFRASRQAIEGGMSEDEAFRHVTGKSTDPAIRKYMGALAAEKKGPARHYQQIGIISPALVASGLGTAAGAHQINNKPATRKRKKR